MSSDGHYEYKPVLAEKYWPIIGPLVTEVVAAAEPHVSYSAKELSTAATALAHWAWQTAALPLEADLIFSTDTIDRFTAEGLARYTKAGRATIRSRLLRIAETINGAVDDSTDFLPFLPSDPTAPYSEKEVTELKFWALSQATPERILNAEALLALGLGAGLAGREIIATTVADIEIGRGGVAVVVHGDRPREVPVLLEWERGLRQIAVARAEDKWAFRAGHETGNPNLISDFVSRARGKINLQARRMHSTLTRGPRWRRCSGLPDCRVPKRWGAF
jgi:integrase